MKNAVRIFKSVQEQENYQKQVMLESTPEDRFRKLYQMQQFNVLLHPVADRSRKIRIGKWLPLEELY